MCRRERRDTPESEGDLLQIGSRVNGKRVDKGMNENGVVRSKK